MKKIKLLFGVLFFAITTFSQTQIKLEEISNHVGDSVKVCGKVFGGIFLENSKGSPTFLNVGGNYPNNPFTIVIWSYLRKEFTEKPEEFYKEKEVCVTGRVELFRDKPQIVLQSKNQISIKE